MHSAPPAKAQTTEERSGAIVVSFDARWAEPFRLRKVKRVLRKRVPQSTDADWLYVYVNSPASCLLARAKLAGIHDTVLAHALASSDAIGLSGREIETYFGRTESMGEYELATIEVAVTPLRLTWLKDHLVFHPPQSFLFLSSKAKQIIDEAAGFKTERLRK